MLFYAWVVGWSAEARPARRGAATPSHSLPAPAPRVNARAPRGSPPRCTGLAGDPNHSIIIITEWWAEHCYA